MNTLNFKLIIIVFVFISFFTSCSEIENKYENYFSPNELIENWTKDYFAPYEDIMPSELASFSQIVIASLYEATVKTGDIKVDTIDFISNTPFLSNIDDASNFTYDVLYQVQDLIEQNLETFYGIIVLPKSINGKMYTRILILTNKHSISTRSSSCAFANDFHWKNGTSCSESKSYKKLEENFNNRCYWRHGNQDTHLPNTVRTFKLAPHNYSDISYELDLPCNSFNDCFENVTNDYIQPQSCHVLSVDPDYCEALTNTDEGPTYKLFHRESDKQSQCITAEEMNFYQAGLEELAFDIKEMELYNLDQSWKYLRVFMDAQGFDNFDRWHVAIFVYEKRVPTLSL